MVSFVVSQAQRVEASTSTFTAPFHTSQHRPPRRGAPRFSHRTRKSHRPCGQSHFSFQKSEGDGTTHSTIPTGPQRSFVPRVSGGENRSNQNKKAGRRPRRSAAHRRRSLTRRVARLHRRTQLRSERRRQYRSWVSGLRETGSCGPLPQTSLRRPRLQLPNARTLSRLPAHTSPLPSHSPSSLSTRKLLSLLYTNSSHANGKNPRARPTPKTVPSVPHTTEAYHTATSHTVPRPAPTHSGQLQ